MTRDYAGPVRRPRSAWRRDPRVMLSALCLCLVALVLLAGMAYGGAPSASATVYVRPGDTVWSIAATHYPGDDVRARVAAIETGNHLDGPSLMPGQALVLPPA